MATKQFKQLKKVKFTSKQGRAQYPWLNEPDTAFNKEPRYKTNLIVQDASSMVAEIEKVAEAEFGKDWHKATMPFGTDEETGETVFKIKSQYAPYFFDSKGAPLVGKQIPTLWSGSVIRVGGYIAPYIISGKKGVTLHLTKVQVIEPVSGSSGSGDDAFDAVDGGFVADELLQDAFDGAQAKTQQEATEAARF